MTHTRAIDRLLQIPHLLEEVFIEIALAWTLHSDTGLYDSQTAKDGRRTLARSARVCRAFVEPALDVLWRDLGDLLVLLRVLPSFKPYTSQSLNILDEITSSQWLRFQSYARRVRTLQRTALQSSVDTVEKMVWVVLESRLNEQPLLPNLRVFSVSDFTQDFLAPLVLLTASLHELELWFPCADLVRHDPILSRSRPLARGVLLQLLIPHCRQLLQLTIRDGLEDTPAYLLSSVTRLNRLQMLDLAYSEAVADFATLQAISQMTALRDLRIKLTLGNAEPTMLPQLGGAFLVLLQLHLTGDIHDLRRVFSACDCARLIELTVNISEETTIDDLQGGLTSICARVPKSLRTARLIISAEVLAPRPLTPASHLLRPFFAFADLRKITVELDQYTPRMDDWDARAFATAWPQLTHFELRYTDWDPELEPTQLTVAGLAEFVQRCPKLCFLMIPYFDIRGTLPALHTLPPVGLVSLRRLDLTDLIGGREANLLDLAVVLDILFPSAGRLHSVTVKENIVGDVLAANETYQPARVTMMLMGAMWARRQGEGERFRGE